ncbi:hypothetical protein TGME49_251710 [Toxoplasma gondii ME49]|uniref:Transmembrane protein n=3 Tax=Toxoplasma gondii TaxID=5811 RepID=A0A125YGM3_TOXGM|nr:hypothetical protein TGME49_251710 [Toxoplasma gondii ME49]EPT25236.1 hypothetical protein TGME49_251710 [Toxoplasma gondii ME49]ESS34563.1 putative transmembrane protein [Toxoplasma gondii VEG]KYF40366.1 hypothetical protein TGARI_251710 [Toxoplasma gondii ARI]CEL78689.1 TPA: hypothetical protein BN1205_000650 [Toxoplasma gondii VEG]|eukprot:XP_002367411.1 hypothetical protein TGME49_251710 [Toxoplasma gondii ME49]
MASRPVFPAAREEGASRDPGLVSCREVPSRRSLPLSSPMESNGAVLAVASPTSESSFPSSCPSLRKATPPRLPLSQAPLHLPSPSASSSGLSTRATFRQLLAQVEQQLGSLTELSCSVRAHGFGTSSSLSLEETRETFDTLRSDTLSSLERANRLLHQLRISSASASGSSSAPVCSPAQLRHFSDLLLSLKAECASACETIALALDRAALLHATSAETRSDFSDGDRGEDKDDEAAAAVFYAREAGSLRESSRMLSSILQAGSSALYALRTQKAVAGKMKEKVHVMATGDAGAVSGLLGQIERQGRKQRLILALVIAACVCLSLLWVMRGHASAVDPGPG